MNSVDYSRKLDLERSNYRQKATENARQTDEYVKDLKENFDKRITNERETNLQNKRDLENQFKDSYDNLDRQSKDSLLDKQLTFNKKLADDRKEFHSVRRENMEDFNRRSKVLNDSYNTSLNDLRETFKTRGDNQQGDFSNKVAFLEADKAEKLQDYQDRALANQRELTQNYRLEKDQIIGDKDQQMHQLVKDETKSKRFIKDTAVKNIDDMRRSQDENLRKGREIANLRFQNLQTHSDQRIKDLSDRNTQTINEMTERSKNDLASQTKDFKERFRMQDYNNQLELREMDFRNKANGVGEDSPNFDILAKQRENEKLSEERRIDILKTQKDNLEQTYAERESKAIDKFQDHYREMRIEMSDKLQTQERELADINRTERYKDLKEIADKDDAHARMIFQERNDAARELGNAKKLARERYEKVSKEYAKNLDRVVLNSNAQVDEFRKDSNKDKLIMQERIETRGREERYTEREILTDKYNKMEESFQKKILSLENKNQETKMQYENKMKNLITKTQDDIARSSKEVRDATDSQLKIERENNDAKLKQLRESMTVQHAASDKKLNDQRIAHTQRMDETTYAYEQKLKTQEQKYKDIIDQNNRKADIDAERLRLATSQEKEALMEQYEQRLERMEALNNQKLTNMEKYAGLQISRKQRPIQA